MTPIAAWSYGGDAATLTWIKTGLDYCVPFVVANRGLLARQRR